MRLDDIRCKHCDALIAMIPRACIRNKFGVECWVCKVTTIIRPLEKPPARVYTERQEVMV